ncbi:MAG: 5'/3'-nucleotidase SurE [Anaerolineae bacterium]|nr:5'/3'-nucleotidase SurE [Anaerolineae bacterium]
MHILVTNDDGIYAPGIFALQNALRGIPGARITIMAPDQNQSTVGHRKTLREPLRITPVTLTDGVGGFACSGSPADAITLALSGYLTEKVDLVVSGINSGPNMGQDITYSGTVTAAMEACIMGVPAIAFSLDQYSDFDFNHAARFAARLVPVFARQVFPPLTLLNVNVPAGVPKGVKITRQGKRLYYDTLIDRVDPSGRPYYWIGGGVPGGVYDDPGTDLWAVNQGYISVTPIELDMTAHNLIAAIGGWGLDFDGADG